MVLVSVVICQDTKLATSLLYLFDAGIMEAPHEPSDRRMGKPRHPATLDPGIDI